MARFVKFGGDPYAGGFFSLDGVAGTYISTPDVNLLDADTAHGVQGIGTYTLVAGSFDTLQVETDEFLFGPSSIGGRVKSITSVAVQRFADGTAGVPTVEGDDRAFGVWVFSTVADVEVRLSGLWNNAGGGLLGAVDGVYQDAPINTWTFFSVFGTAPASTAFAGVQIQHQKKVGSFAIGDQFYWDQSVIREGAVTSFVPSLRIVGDIETQADVALDTWATGFEAIGARYLNSPTADRSWFASVTSTGAIKFTWYDSADAIEARTSSAVTGLADGARARIKSTLELDGSLNFYVDDVQLGTTIAAGAFPALRVGDAPFEVGSWNNGLTDILSGDVFDVYVKDGIDGPIVARFSPDDYLGGAGAVPDSSTFTDSVTGREWTTHGGITNTLVDYGDSVVVEGLTIPIQTFIVKDPVGMSDEIDGFRWVVGAGWVGDGYKATMHQGNDALGPIVAQFEAEDIGL